ncbi:MAG TPA: LPXTG cell wall anchor domain-containing protein [Candidatus Thermoplasmatota archaeon]|nr:LPXTG cell wall anchor domain-containing protein [Candidatus Thermoplasmatota archaeon]
MIETVHALDTADTSILPGDVLTARSTSKTSTTTRTTGSSSTDATADGEKDSPGLTTLAMLAAVGIAFLAVRRRVP